MRREVRARWIFEILIRLTLEGDLEIRVVVIPNIESKFESRVSTSNSFSGLVGIYLERSFSLEQNRLIAPPIITFSVISFCLEGTGNKAKRFITYS